MTKWRMAWQATAYWTWHRFVCNGENKTLYDHLQVLLFFLRPEMISGLHLCLLVTYICQ